MDAHPATVRFIGDTFNSVWTLELLLKLKGAADQSFSPEQLVDALRASEVVVAKGLASLSAVGLVIEEARGRIRYNPASADLEEQVEQTERLYRARPDAVRRLIIRSASRGLSAFADSFRFRGD